MTVPFTRGLHQVSPHCHAWLQPDGGWGLSNAGLITSGGESLLVDTMFDLAHTREMLDAMAPITSEAPIRSVVNTHADGDHCHGNQLVDGAEVIASTKAGARMTPAHLAEIQTRMASDAPGSDYMRQCFARFDFTGVDLQQPDRTFDGELSLQIGDLTVDLIEMPPAHTGGDTVVFVPRDRVLYAGDILFIDGAPIAWMGPLTSWAAACDQLIALEPEVVVPGHGPITDVAGIARVRDYLLRVDSEAREAHSKGWSVVEAARRVDMSGFEHLRQYGRLLQNILNVYRELDPETPPIRLMYEIERLENERAARSRA